MTLEFLGVEGAKMKIECFDGWTFILVAAPVRRTQWTRAATRTKLQQFQFGFRDFGIS